MISPSTICYALKMTYDFLRSEYLCEKTECNRKRLDEFSDIIDEIDNGKLAIEGYERSEWTKFDSSKGNTYPPKEMFLAWGLPDPDCSDTPTVFVCWRNNYGFSCDESAYPEVHFWRPLPKPPQETEEAK